MSQITPFAQRVQAGQPAPTGYAPPLAGGGGGAPATRLSGPPAVTPIGLPPGGVVVTPLPIPTSPVPGAAGAAPPRRRGLWKEPADG